MRIPRNFKEIKALVKDHSINFSKYTIVGIIVSILNVFFVWLLIDVFNIKTIIATSVIIGCLYLLKFYLYILIKLIKKQFVKFLFIQAISSITNILLTWFFIDILLIPTIVATSSVIVMLFLFRYILFHVLGLIKNE